MAVDRAWLERTRRANREALGMAGLGDLGLSAQTERLQGAFNKAPTRVDPTIGVPLAPVIIPVAPKLPKAFVYGGAAILIGMVGLVAYKVLRGR